MFVSGEKWDHLGLAPGGACQAPYPHPVGGGGEVVAGAFIREL